MARLEARPRNAPLAATRVVIDVRPLQEPERAALTAEYLRHLLAAFAAEPLAGESFVVLTRALRPDPTIELERDGLAVASRRVLPPTSRVFRSAGLTLDTFLLRAAEIGAALPPSGAAVPGGAVPQRGAAPPPADDDASPVGTIYHTAGGAVPLGSRLPVVATLLDVAPWELPESYLASPAARFGHRLRQRVLRDAARVIVCSSATADTARRRLHLPRERVAIVPLAVDDEFRAAGRDAARRAEVRQRLALPPRYLVFAGRYDARKDMPTLFEALRSLASTDAASRSAKGRGAPTIVFGGPFDSLEERETLVGAVLRSGAAGRIEVAPMLSTADRAALIGGAVGFVYPALSEATALAALEALSVGVPVIASRTGALPEQVGGAGIIVEPRDARRLASALAAMWETSTLASQLTRAARARADSWARNWQDVARETRAVYAAVALEAQIGPRR
jgi:glycosyltransferase involved in cell wall biosynthesis